MRVTYFAAISSDGFIAKEDGDVSWLDEVEMDMSQIGYEDFFASVDALVMGRHTYDFVYNYGSWPYGDKLTWVLTSSRLEGLEGANLRVVSSLDDLLEEVTENTQEHLWLVGGGELASSFVERKLLTNLSIAEMPVELGKGIPLFARHNFQTMTFSRKNTISKAGFRQIDIEV